jgi:hypothetical protein
MWTVKYGSGQGLVVGFCEHGNELPGSMKGGKFLASCVTGSF